jgi:hypothetical protein
VPAEELAIGRSKDVRSRRSRTEEVPKPVDVAAFKVDTGKQRRQKAFLAIIQERPRLRCAFYVSCKQYHSCRLQPSKEGTDARRHLRPVEADNEKLADLVNLPLFLSSHVFWN